MAEKSDQERRNAGEYIKQHNWRLGRVEDGHRERPDPGKLEVMVRDSKGSRWVSVDVLLEILTRREVKL